MRDTTAVPSVLQTAWGLRERPSKGPRPTLTTERIVEAAVRIAAAEGFGAVSMNRVAGELSTSAMALYRHVANKEELTVLMLESVAGHPPEPIADGETWRAALERWAFALFAMYREHRWFLQAPIPGPPATPRQLAWVEVGLTALTGTRLGEGEKLSVILLLSGFVRNEASIEGQMVEAARAGERTLDAVMAEYGTLLRHLVQPDRFPALRRVIDAGVMDVADHPDTEFVFGLTRVLDGIDLMVRYRADQG
ncbi:TetR/AcrR family transcriptional regulator [Paractinoplanes rishiriensis]|uniref:TetR family transcriptional regulator n=1 Tax=Paractinoplanes rishiriensis TaxID=1050105 RepID=A0A919JV08_9ACTN|nr:TetR/AcrR family transcriptional regulator [Actinoplanes rishiriensis]GIE95308.1 TetR family transcriptional regulator [Actinoplanes rishiriensis]